MSAQNREEVLVLLQRASQSLAEGAWDDADAFCRQAHLLEPDNASAYIGRLLAELRLQRVEELATVGEPLSYSENFRNAVRCAQPDAKRTLLDCNASIAYNTAMKIMTTANNKRGFLAAAAAFREASGYSDADALVLECEQRAEAIEQSLLRQEIDNKNKDKRLSDAETLIQEDTPQALSEAIQLLQTITGWRNADMLAVFCKRRMEEIRDAERVAELQQEKERAAARRLKNRRKRKRVLLLIFILLLLGAALYWLPEVVEYIKAFLYNA